MVGPVWMYWEDGEVPRPPYLDLCAETILIHAADCELRVLDRESVRDWLPGLSGDVWRRLPSPVHRSDYARTRLLYHHGGLWLDADTIALRPLSEVTVLLEHADVVGWGRELDGRFYNNFFGARPNAPLLAEWIRAQDAVIRDQGVSRLSYAALGQDIVPPLARRHPCLNLPVRRVAPVGWYAVDQFFSRVQSPRRLLKADPYVVVLWNKVMGPRLQHRSRDQLLTGSTLLSRLLRIGLERATPAEESGGTARLDPVGRLRYTTPGRRIEVNVRRVAAATGRRAGRAAGR